MYEFYIYGSVGGKGRGGIWGGNGGGMLWMNVIGLIDVDGLVFVNGEDVLFLIGSGGGSGGSIWMYCKMIRGYGRIVVNGGVGFKDSLYFGGGGVGGRVVIYF